jgi:hypothetical protein
MPSKTIKSNRKTVSLVLDIKEYEQFYNIAKLQKRSLSNYLRQQLLQNNIVYSNSKTENNFENANLNDELKSFYKKNGSVANPSLSISKIDPSYIDDLISEV